LVFWSDRNSDGKPDLQFRDSVMLGNGDGTFQAAQPVNDLRDESRNIALFRTGAAGGSTPSVVGLDYQFGCARLLLADARGKIGWTDDLCVRMTPTYSPAYIGAVGDFNGDGNLDAALADGNNSVVNFFAGDGTGAFRNVSELKIPPQTTFLEFGDFNGDGKPDLAACNVGCVVANGNGDGAFVVEANLGAGAGRASAAVADWNGDGMLDLVIANLKSGTITVLQNVTR
jgi:hypothetical protein